MNTDTRPPFQRVYSVLKATASAFAQDKVTQRGAALSFFTVFALPPLLVLLVMLLSLVLDGATVQNRILQEVQKAGDPNTLDVVKTILSNANPPDGSNRFAAIVSLSMLLFSATNVFAQLQDMLNTIWGVRVRSDIQIWGLVKIRLLSFGLILSLGLLIVVSTFLEVGLSVLQNLLEGHLHWLEQQMAWLSTLQFFKGLSRSLSFLLLIGALAAVFKILPDVRVSWRDVFIGAFFTACLLSISRFLIGWYLSSSAIGSAYGAAGSTILFLFWMYLNIQLFLLGAEFTEALAEEYGRSIQPRNYAEWLPEKHLADGAAFRPDDPVPADAT